MLVFPTLRRLILDFKIFKGFAKCFRPFFIYIFVYIFFYIIILVFDWTIIYSGAGATPKNVANFVQPFERRKGAYIHTTEQRRILCI